MLLELEAPEVVDVPEEDVLSADAPEEPALLEAAEAPFVEDPLSLPPVLAAELEPRASVE